VTTPRLHRLPASAWWAPVAAVVVLIAVVYLPERPTYDLNVYLRAAHAWWHGGAVYPATTTHLSGPPFAYPFVTLWPYLPLALVPHAVAVAVNVVGATAAIVVMSRAVGLRSAVQLMLVLLNAFVITGLQLGNLSVWLLPGVLALWLLRDRPWLFALVAGPVLAAKLVLLPLLLWPIVARRWKAAGLAAAATLAVLAVGFVTGPLGPRGYERLLAAVTRRESAQGMGLVAALQKVGLASRPAELVAVGVGCLVLLGVVRRWQVWHDETTVYAGAIVIALLVTPVIWSHYLVLLAAPLVVRRASAPVLAGFAAASWALAPPHGSTTWSVVLGLVLVTACACWGRLPAIRGIPPARLLTAAIAAGLGAALLVALAGNARADSIGLGAWLGVVLVLTLLVVADRLPPPRTQLADPAP
jgi:alpha-1,2-mannosyltransferase